MVNTGGFRLKDHFLLGFIPGLILPLIGFYLYFLLMFSYMGWGNFLSHVIKTNLAVSVLSLGVILNLGLFMLFYTRGMDRSAQGVIGSTFVYAFIVVYFKVLR